MSSGATQEAAGQKPEAAQTTGHLHLPRLASRLLKGTLPALLFSWYALLTLYAANMDGMIIQDIAGVWLSTTLIVLGLYLVLTLLLRQPEKATVLSTALVAIFFSYGHLLSWIQQQLTLQASQTVMTLGMSILLGLICYFLITKRQQWSIDQLVTIMIGVSAIALLTTTIQFLPAEIANQQQRAIALQAVKDLPASPESSPQVKPDVYFIILDRYAATITQQQYYHFDNAEFTANLTDRGFYIATDSRANYPKTLFSLTSTLNMDYLQDLLPQDRSDLAEAYAVQPMLSNNQVGRLFKRLGYTYYHTGNWYELTQTLQAADHNILPTRHDFIHLNSYTRQLLETTIYPPLAELLRLPTDWYQFDSRAQANWANFQVDQIKQLSSQPSPKFVTAHTLLSHDPYVFDAQCHQLDQLIERWNATVADYLNQLQCANQRALEIIDTILANSATKPIIILQSDEGPEAMIEPTGHHWKFQGVAQSAITERTHILNAILFPDQDYSQLYSTITPVNTFRTVFRQYFGYDLPNLADTTYLWPDKDHLFDFYESPKEGGS